MKIEASTVDEYLSNILPSQKEPVGRLRQVINQHLPSGFEETMSYGMIGWVVPKSAYPSGYHVNPSLTLPFINLAAQKRHIALYHMGLYADIQLLEWFTEAYSKQVSSKIDMGKSCIRFKNPDVIPYALIGQLCEKLSIEQWISKYELSIKNVK